MTKETLTLVEAVQQFTDERKVEQMFIQARWPDGIACYCCGSVKVARRNSYGPAAFRCGDCGKCFSVKSGTVMQGSNLPLSKWALAAYLMTTQVKGVSSMQLHRALGVTQKTAWHLAHRIRKALESEHGLFAGPVEVDETYVGGKVKNRHAWHKKNLPVKPKTIVAGIKDRATNQVVVKVVPDTTKHTLQGFIRKHVKPGAQVFTDEAKAYQGLPNHSTVCHSKGQYAVGDVSTNGIEGFWSMLKRGIMGAYHYISPKHTERYAVEFAERHNLRPFGFWEQVRRIMSGMVNKRLRYKDLIA